jgi:hypothetical protein
MKKVLIIICLAAGFGNVKAQSNKEDIDIIQSAFGKNKKTLVSVYMNVPAKDSVAFWKLYDEYEDKRKAIGKERINIIQQYADQYEKLTDEQATKLAQSAFNNNEKYDKLYEAYFPKFSAILGGKNAAKLFQLELYLQTFVRAVVMDHIPFIGELDKEKIENSTQQ